MTPTEIIRAVEVDYCLPAGTLVGRDRTAHVSEARAVAVGRLYRETGLTMAAIGRLLGGRDHSTIHHLWRVA